MAGMAAKLVSEFFEGQNTRANDLNDNVLTIGWGFTGGTIEIFFEFDDTDTHVHLEGVNFLQIPEEKFDRMYRVLNDCNDRFPQVKFVLDTRTGQIVARDDAVIQPESCGPECFELMCGMVRIVEAAYPDLMKVMWEE